MGCCCLEDDKRQRTPTNIFNHFMVVYITLGHDHNMSDPHLVFLKDAMVYKLLKSLQGV